MNALQKALVNSGLAKEPKPRKFRSRTYKCSKCGAPMEIREGTNIMACTACSNYYLFTDSKSASKKEKK